MNIESRQIETRKETRYRYGSGEAQPIFSESVADLLASHRISTEVNTRPRLRASPVARNVRFTSKVMTSSSFDTNSGGSGKVKSKLPARTTLGVIISSLIRTYKTSEPDATSLPGQSPATRRICPGACIPPK